MVYCDSSLLAIRQIELTMAMLKTWFMLRVHLRFQFHVGHSNIGSTLSRH